MALKTKTKKFLDELKTPGTVGVSTMRDDLETSQRGLSKMMRQLADFEELVSAARRSEDVGGRQKLNHIRKLIDMALGKRDKLRRCAQTLEDTIDQIETEIEQLDDWSKTQ